MKLSLAFLMASLVAALAPVAHAAGPATVGVRVEGATTTLFEGPLRSAGNPVRAASDTQQHRCDGTNNSAHGAPGASATGAAVEGLRLAGQDFDAKWFPGFDDYYINRFGPDAENVNTYVYWGVTVDDVFTDVGGCQAQVADGNRVLWAYDAFHDRGFLKLAAAGDVGATPQPTATVVTGRPLTVRVTRAYGEKSPVFAAAGGMTVAPVSTAANGTQTVQAGSPEAVTTAPADGTADIVFSAPGWHRIKADGGPTGPIRSNRLDVCVIATPGGSCGAPPADTLVREAPPLPPDPIDPGVPGGAGGRGGGAGNGKAPGGAVGAPTIELPRFGAAGRARGRIGVSWRVLNAGVGVKSWRLESRAAGARSGTWTVRATGTKGTSALLALPSGRSWSVRATFVDKLNRTVGQTIGDVLVPLDAGARHGVRRSGRWTRKADARAWLGAVHRARAGATLTAKLAAGKPVVLVRGVRTSADIEVRAGGRVAVYRVSASTTVQTREIVAASRKAAGSVRVRIVRGEAGIDGVGVRP
jgi:hypothetical protein